ncbi:unnamed protein product [Meganyctiphanes norvegica]|uniref:Major facilitator superfamily (MFS) profile domain-containing protein n=1 Tax=Meganyctiphanes norvegica TaxID=48144 RepID=A0AAV2PIB5_MEGNR
MGMKNFDDIFDHIGGFGLYQFGLFTVTCYINTLMSFTYFGQMFMSLTPPHWCSPPPEFTSANLTNEEIKKLTIPINENGEYHKCKRYDINFTEEFDLHKNIGNDTSWPTTTCDHGITYNFSLYYPTITSELNWVCDEDWKPSFAQSLFFVGSVFGCQIFGYMADKYGRLPAIVLSNTIGGIAGVASAFANSFIIFTILRFIVGMVFDSHLSIIYMLMLEYVSSEYRSVVANVPIMIFLTLGMVILPWMAIGLGDWRWLTVIIHFPHCICILLIWIIPESMRWNISKGNVDNAVKTLKAAAKVNKKTLSEDFIEDFKAYAISSKEGEKKVTILDLLKTPNLRKRFILLICMWLVIQLTYDGHMRNTENIGTNVFITFTMSGLIELPADLVTIFSMDWLGRRHTTVWSLVLSGVASLIISLFRPDQDMAILVTAMVGRFLITMAINVGMQYQCEVIPTVSRGQGTGAIHTLGFAFSFFSPYIVYLSKFKFWLPYFVMGLLSIAGGLACLGLPETLQESLPDTLEDGENAFAQQPCCYNPFNRKKSKDKTESNENGVDNAVYEDSHL